MKKRIITTAMIIILTMGMLPLSVLAAAGLSNFKVVKIYSGQFTDVPVSQWYYGSVEAAFEYNLINGISSTKFAPDSNLKLSEAIKLAACLHSIYYTGKANFAVATPWYQPYVDYALKNGIITSNYRDYEAYAKRSDFAQIFENAFPNEALSAINTVEYGAIPDVSLSDNYGPAVYELYRAGILKGNDSKGTFSPNSYIKRAEVAAIVTRMADQDLRKVVTLTLKKYETYFRVPDYGAFFNAPLYSSYRETGYVEYYYKRNSLTVGYDDYFYGYGDLLEGLGFVFVEEYTDIDGYATLSYQNKVYHWNVVFGPTKLNGVECILVIIDVY